MQLRSIHRLTTAVVCLLAVQIVVMVVEALAFMNRINLLHRVEAGDFVTQQQGESADATVGGVGTIGTLLFFATIIVWCIWQHRAQRNAGELAVGDLKFTPGWAVGWWFIPFANLVKPFQTVRELWKASHGGDAWKQRSTWPVIGWWWALWIACNIHIWSGGNGDFGVGFGDFGGPTSLAGLLSHDRWEIVSLGLRAGAAILAIMVVRSIAGLQAAAASSRPAGSSQASALPPLPAPPPE
jgi:hypothetical protein